LNPKAYLRRNIKRRVALGHPWIYDNEIQSCDSVDDGQIVDVFTSSDQFLGRGYFNSLSTIRIRLLTRKNIEINGAFFREKILRAFNKKKALLNNGDSLRVVFGEADGLPGMIVDKFADFLVVQFNTLGIYTFRREIVDVLLELFSPKGIYEKSEGSSLEKEGLVQTGEWLAGDGPILIPFNIDGLRFLADMKGQKTGFFLDQRENAMKLAFLSNDRFVIDLFSYTGNFAFHCLNYGARSVVLVDISERALEVSEEIAKMNGFEHKCEFVKANAFDYLRNGDISKADIVIIDPPAMAKNTSSKSSALRGYKELNLRGIKNLRNDRVLATSSCTQIVSEEDWLKCINEAFADSKKLGTLIYRGGQPLDHPEVSSIFETKYLKFRVFSVHNIAEL
jgi:23S rRNA (cytosine1962-C5)-methyltransferase